MVICQAIDESLGCLICKNLFLSNHQNTRFYLLMIPADKTFHTKHINSSRLSFAPGEYMEKYRHAKPGSASVTGLMNDLHSNVALLVDEDVLQQEYIGCHPCVNTSSLKIKAKDIFETFFNQGCYKAEGMRITN